MLTMSLIEVKRTSQLRGPKSENDPKRHWGRCRRTFGAQIALLAYFVVSVLLWRRLGRESGRNPPTRKRI